MFNTHKEEWDDYLRRLHRPLRGLPPDARAEAQQELRQHLDALVAAHRELGATEDAAVRAALRSFGDPARVGRRLVREWQRKHSRVSTEWWAVLFTLAFYALAVSVTRSGDIFMGRTTDTVQVIVALVVIPLVTGATTGLLFPKVAVASVLFATLSTASLLLLPAVLLLALEPDAGTIYAFKVFTVQAMCWLPLSCLAAYVTSALRRKELYRVIWRDLKLTRS